MQINLTIKNITTKFVLALCQKRVWSYNYWIIIYGNFIASNQKKKLFLRKNFLVGKATTTQTKNSKHRHETEKPSKQSSDKANKKQSINEQKGEQNNPTNHYELTRPSWVN